MLLAISCSALAVADQLPHLRVFRIGILVVGDLKDRPRHRMAFVDELTRLGYVEGRDVQLVERSGHGDFGRLDNAAAELAAEKVDVIVAASTYDVRAAQKATATIPIVMVTSADPVAIGLVADLKRSGNNVTGQSLMTVELSAKRLEIIKDAMPRVGRVGVLWNPNHPIHGTVVKGIRDRAPALSLQPIFVSASTPEQLPSAITEAKRSRAEALLVIEDPFFFTQKANIIRLAAGARLPAMYGAKDYVDAGGLMGYGPNYEALWRGAAGYVDKILKGAAPSELPIEQPTQFDLVVSRRAARELKLQLSEKLLLQVTEVVR